MIDAYDVLQVSLDCKEEDVKKAQPGGGLLGPRVANRDFNLYI